MIKQNRFPPDLHGGPQRTRTRGSRTVGEESRMIHQRRQGRTGRGGHTLYDTGSNVPRRARIDAPGVLHHMM